MYDLRPGEHEYAPFYAGYVKQVPDGNILELLENQAEQTRTFLTALTKAQAMHRYAPCKWRKKVKPCHQPQRLPGINIPAVP
jgi:hypothetical protein